MATLSSVLAQIRTNESGGNYTAQNPTSTASGAYQFVNGTWQSLTQQSGIGTQYATAGSAPPNVQDAVAAYALGNNPNANSCSLWGTCNAAGQVTGPARYPVVDTYDTTPQQLLSSTSLAANTGDPTNQGFGSNGSGQILYYTGTDANGNPATDTNPAALTNPQPVYAGSTTTGGSTTTTVSPTGSTSYNTTSGQTGLGTGAEVGYTPPAATGGPSTVGLAPGVAGQINTIAQNATNSFTGAVGGLFSGVENWMARAGLIVVAVVILLVALWRVMDPSGEKTKAFVSKAGEAVAA